MKSLLNNLKNARKQCEIRANKLSDESSRVHEEAVAELASNDPGYQLAVDWSKALSDINAGTRDALDVSREFEDRTQALVDKGVDSPVIPQINQSLPKITDLGLVAAFKQQIDQLLKESVEAQKSEKNYKVGDTFKMDWDGDSKVKITKANSDGTFDIVRIGKDGKPLDGDENSMDKVDSKEFESLEEEGGMTGDDPIEPDGRDIPDGGRGASLPDSPDKDDDTLNDDDDSDESKSESKIHLKTNILKTMLGK